MNPVAQLKDEARRHEQAEQWEQAIEAYDAILRSADSGEARPPLYNRVGDLYVRLGRPMDAVDCYAKAADYYAEAGLYNNAIAFCNKALRYGPNRLELLRKRGQLCAAQGFYTDARRSYLEYADRQLENGEQNDAFTALEEFAARYEEDAEIRAHLGRLLQAHNRRGPAVAALRRAQELYQQRGDSAAAEAVRAEVLRLASDAFAAGGTEGPSAAAVVIVPAADPQEPPVTEPASGFPDERRGLAQGTLFDLDPDLEGELSDQALEQSILEELAQSPFIEKPAEAGGPAPENEVPDEYGESHDAFAAPPWPNDRTPDSEPDPRPDGSFADFEPTGRPGESNDAPSLNTLRGAVAEPTTPAFDLEPPREPEPPAGILLAVDAPTAAGLEQQLPTDPPPVDDRVALAPELSHDREQVDPAQPDAVPVKEPRPRAKRDYVDLLDLVADEEDDGPNTRFLVVEQTTGDEDRDFADLLLQFKRKLAENLSVDETDAHYDLGLAFKEMGLVDEAIAEFQIAMKGGSHRLKVCEELGNCFMLKEQYAVAVNVLSRALQLKVDDDGDLLGVYYTLARAHEELGQAAQARAAYERVIGLDINFRDASQRLTNL